MNRGGLASSFSNPFVTGTLVVAFIAWWTAFIAQIVVEARYHSLYDGGSAAGFLWFAIFLQLFVILGVIWGIASGQLAIQRYQLSLWVAVALVFSVLGTDRAIYGALPNESASRAMGAGYLLLSIINILWLSFFSCDESSPIFQRIVGFGGGDIIMNRRSMQGSNGHLRRSSSAQRMNGGISSHNANFSPQAPNHNAGVMNGYGTAGMTKDLSRASHGSLHSNASLQLNQSPMNPNQGGLAPSIRSITQQQNGTAGDPLAGHNQPPVARARALYAYAASPDDPNELSFAKGEVLDILDRTGKWFSARKADGRTGIVPSNYLRDVEA